MHWPPCRCCWSAPGACCVRMRRRCGMASPSPRPQGSSRCAHPRPHPHPAAPDPAPTSSGTGVIGRRVEGVLTLCCRTRCGPRLYTSPQVACRCIPAVLAQRWLARAAPPPPSPSLLHTAGRPGGGGPAALGAAQLGRRQQQCSMLRLPQAAAAGWGRVAVLPPACTTRAPLPDALKCCMGGVCSMPAGRVWA